MVPLSEDMRLDDIIIRWNREFAFGRVGLVPIADISDSKHLLKLTSAIHSRYGNVAQKLSQVDRKYAELDSAETIDLIFDAPDIQSTKLLRSFVLETNGYYVAPENEVISVPNNFGLEQNYPNPFNPSTTIRYTLKENSKVSLIIYNTLGQVVKTLVEKEETAGIKNITWDGMDNSGKQVASGIYIYKLKAGNSVFARKMIYIK